MNPRILSLILINEFKIKFNLKLMKLIYSIEGTALVSSRNTAPFKEFLYNGNTIVLFLMEYETIRVVILLIF